MVQQGKDGAAGTEEEEREREDKEKERGIAEGGRIV